ncbi:MAG: glycosyltransferase [Patescibacteria group bacterium]
MLSIIIPTLNEENYLPRLIRSIKRQGFSDYEIIVSDGGSKDNTEKIARENNCRFVSDTEHHHPSWQRNNGAAIAVGDILLFLDADTVLQDGFLERVIPEFIKRNLVGAGFYFEFNPNSPSYRIFSYLSNFFCFFRQFFSPASVGAGLLAKRETHNLIKGFDPEVLLAEDYDYCERLSRHGKFRIITSCNLLYSSRRIQKEGWFKTGLAWTKMAAYTVFRRKIKNDKIKYEFGKF